MGRQLRCRAARFARGKGPDKVWQVVNGSFLVVVDGLTLLFVNGLTLAVFNGPTLAVVHVNLASYAPVSARAHFICFAP